MTAMNVVHMRVKPGKEAEFLALSNPQDSPDLKGLRNMWVIKTGERSYCLVGEWDSMDDLAAARPHMIATLDTFRDMLDGDTDPVSGPVVLELK